MRRQPLRASRRPCDDLRPSLDIHYNDGRNDDLDDDQRPRWSDDLDDHHRAWGDHDLDDDQRPRRNDDLDDHHRAWSDHDLDDDNRSSHEYIDVDEHHDDDNRPPHDHIDVDEHHDDDNRSSYEHHDDDHDDHVGQHHDDDHDDPPTVRRASGTLVTLSLRHLDSGRCFASALLAVGLLWLALRVVSFTGYYTEDAPGYVSDAIQCVLGTYRARAHILGLNVATYLPVAVPLALFGKTDLAVGLWPLLCSLLGLVSLTGASTLLFGRRFGLLAALLYATYPGDVFFSTVVMPDAIQAGWLAFSLLLVVVAWCGPAAGRRWKLAGGGLAMGVCLLVRANGVLLLPIGLVAVVLLGWRGRRETKGTAARALAAYVAGWALVPALEGVAYLRAVGDVLHRLHVVDRHYGTAASLARWGLNTDWRTIPFSIFPPLHWWRLGGWGTFNQDQAYHGQVFCIALVAVVLGTLTLIRAKAPAGDRATTGFLLGVFWLAWPLLIHEFGSQSLTHYVPMHRLSRHLVVYAPGAVFAAVAGCALVVRAAAGWRIAEARRSLTAAGLLVLALHLWWNWQATQVSSAAFHRIEGTYLRIREHLPPQVRAIVADPGDLCFMDFWLNPLGEERVKLSPFAAYSRCEDLPEGVVLTRSNPGWENLAAPIIQETVKRLPCLVQPPPSWRLLYGGFPEKVFTVP